MILEISDDECEPKYLHDEDYECSIYSPQSVSDQNRYSLSNLARKCDRYGISDRAGASIAHADLQDYGLLTRKI